MSKKHRKAAETEETAAPDAAETKKARNKAYEKELASLQVEIVAKKPTV